MTSEEGGSRDFEWFEQKAMTNVQKHGVTFEEAETVFSDRTQAHRQDPEHSIGEQRYICVGMSVQNRLLMVVYTERPGNVTRIISARKATKKEEEFYVQENS
jgi:uncharacterized protein